MRKNLLPLVISFAALAITNPAFAGACDGTPLPPGAGYRTANGKIYAPDGSNFIAKGVNDANIANDYQTLLATFPGINHVRVPVYQFENPADFAPAIQYLTSHGVVVELENHQTTDGSNAGGGAGYIPTPGDSYWNTDISWFQQVGALYGNNALVWAGSTNEPPAYDHTLLANWQTAEYQAFRQGSTAPFEIQVEGWSDTGSLGAGYVASAYQTMTNIIADTHVYPGLTNMADMQTDQSFIQAYAGNFEQSGFQSADGPIPIIFGEIGPSTYGPTLDTNGYQLVQAAMTAGYGFDAWWFTNDAGNGDADALRNSDGSLTYFGQLVAQGITGATGCPINPITPPNYVFPATDTYESPTAPLQPTQQQLQLSDQLKQKAELLHQAVENMGLPTTPLPFVSTNNGYTVSDYTGGDLRAEPFVTLATATQATQAITPDVITIVNTINKIAENMPMLSPVGSFLVHMDQAITGALDTTLQAHTAALAAPLVSLCALAIALLGLKIMKGSQEAKLQIPGLAAKCIIILGLATNIGNFDYYVRGFLYTALPNYMMPVSKYAGTDGMTAIAAYMDHTWAVTWQQVSKVYMQAGLFDFGSRLGAELCGITVGIFLAIMALVVIIARFLLAITLYFMPYAIALLLFDQTKAFFERVLGKCVSLIVLQVCVVLILTILQVGDTWFLTQISPYLAGTSQGMAGALTANGGNIPTTASDFQNLVGIIVWFGMGAFAFYASAPLAYSIGGGVVVSMFPLALAAVGAAKAIGAMMSAGAGAASNAMGGSGTASSSENYSMSFASNSLSSNPPTAIEGMTPLLPE